MIDAITAGVNYIIFEPSFDGLDLLSYELTPPFDGSDPDFPSAATPASLYKILKEERGINKNGVEKYLKNGMIA